MKARLPRQARYPLTTMLPKLEAFFDTDVGQEILAAEQAVLSEALKTSFGYHLMQLSVSRNVILHDDSPIRHKFSLAGICVSDHDGVAVVGEPGKPCYSAVAAADELPLESQSVDVVILHHVLEFSQNPHQLLRETERVLLPHGKLLILGFNPWSLLGLWSRISGLNRNSIWQNRSISQARLCDWLSLLDFDVQTIQFGFYRPPIKQNRILNRLGGLETLGDKLELPFGGFYCVEAKKEVARLTPVKPRWFTKSNLMPGLEAGLYRHPIRKKPTLH